LQWYKKQSLLNSKSEKMNNIKSIILLFVLVIASTGLAFSQTDSTKTVTLKVKGLNCADDVVSISDNVTKLKGVSSCAAGNPGATTSFTVKFVPARINENEIRAAVENTPGCDDPNQKPYKVKK
jgi:copper chaperone CopZ